MGADSLERLEKVLGDEHADRRQQQCQQRVGEGDDTAVVERELCRESEEHADGDGECR